MDTAGTPPLICGQQRAGGSPRYKDKEHRHPFRVDHGITLHFERRVRERGGGRGRETGRVKNPIRL
jgi:hypothetical protein